jgi:hypothetical protein
VIKRYILHIEWHLRRRPHISLRRIPKHGEKGTDGGLTGTFINCQSCSGVGQLFEPDEYPLPNVQPEDMDDILVRRPRQSWHESPRAMDFNMPVAEAPRPWDMNWTESRPDIPPVWVSEERELPEPETELILGPASMSYPVDSIVWYKKSEWRVLEFEPGKRVRLRKLPVG